MSVVLAFLVAVGQFVPAFLGFDLTLRWVDVRSDGLRGRLDRWALGYGVAGLVFAALGAWWMVSLASGAGLALAPLGLVPWWLLWRFGLRKQFTYLYKADGGRPHGEG